MVLVEDITDRVVAKMTAVEPLRELPRDVAAIRCLVLGQAIAGIGGLKFNVLNDHFPITLKILACWNFIGMDVDRGINLRL